MLNVEKRKLGHIMQLYSHAQFLNRCANSFLDLKKTHIRKSYIKDSR